jgi:hypothetical protein
MGSNTRSDAPVIDPKPPGGGDGGVDVDLRTPREVAKAKRAKEAGPPLILTGEGTHRALERGYAIDTISHAGILCEPGDVIPANATVGEWMEEIPPETRADKQDATKERVIAEATAPRKGDPVLEDLSLEALQALATDAGVQSVKGASEEDLIAAIRASS